jgi:hypothetical protein
MNNQKEKQKPSPSRIFYENPYDLETLFEALAVASEKDKELIFVDRLITFLRLDPQADITHLSFSILRDLEIVKLETS